MCCTCHCSRGGQGLPYSRHQVVLTFPALRAESMAGLTKPAQSRETCLPLVADEASEPTFSITHILHCVEWRRHPGCFRTKTTPCGSHTVLVRSPGLQVIGWGRPSLTQAPSPTSAPTKMQARDPQIPIQYGPLPLPAPPFWRQQAEALQTTLPPAGKSWGTLLLPGVLSKIPANRPPPLKGQRTLKA